MLSGSSDASRRSLRRAVRMLLLALTGLGMGCSLTRPKVDDCHDNSQCRAAFGYGMVCASGRCQRAAANPRCTEALPADLLVQPGRYAGWHVYGSLMDHSSPTQIGRENAVRLAATEVDQQGGLAGKSMAFVFCDIAQDPTYDSRTRTQAAVEAAKYLANQIGVPAIVGPSASPDTLAVYNAVKDYGTLVISPAATSTALTGVDTPSATDENPGLLWRTVPPDSVQGDAIATYLNKRGVKDVAVVQESGAYGEGLDGVFVPAFKALGGAAQVYSFSSSAERDSAIQSAGADPAPWVLFISSQTSDVVAFALEANTSGSYASKQLFLTDSAANSDFLNGAKAAQAIFPHIQGSRVQPPDQVKGSTYPLFKSSYENAFGQDPGELSYTANSYDAAWLVFYGSAWSLYQDGSVTGIGIARGLRNVSSGDPVPIDPSNWSKVVTSFQAGQSINVAGASSALDYDPVTEELKLPIEIWAINSTNNGFSHVETIQP